MDNEEQENLVLNFGYQPNKNVRGYQPITHANEEGDVEMKKTISNTPPNRGSSVYTALSKDENND